MKRIITVLAMAALAVGTMMANWHPSDTEATRLDKEGESGQTQMKTLRADDGVIALSWLRGERVNGVFSYRLHLQLFDAQGNAMFGDEGIIVCDKRTRTWTTDYALALAPNGDILLAYTDVRNDPNEDMAESYLYRYTRQGTPVWGEDGILFPSKLVHENAFVIEDIAPKICVSGDKIYAAVMHSEYFMEEANEDNWTPSPWFPNQPMPDSVQVNESCWMITLLADDGTVLSETPKMVSSAMLTMNPAPDGQVYLVYENKELGLDAEMLNADLESPWEEVITIEDKPISGGMYVPTPLTAVNDNGTLMLSYRVLNDFYGYQVVNFITPDAEIPWWTTMNLNGDNIDGDAGSAAMATKGNQAFVAWEWAYSSSAMYMRVNAMNDEGEFCWQGDNTLGNDLDFTEDWGFTPVKVIPANEGWVVLYGSSTSWNGANFMVVKVDDMGDVMWSKQICEDDFKSSGFAVTYDENNAYIFYTQEEQYDDNWDIIPGSGGMFVMCVDIAGKTTSVGEVQTAEDIVKTEIYTIDGRRIDNLEKGVNIVRTTDSAGTTKTVKVMH